MTADADAGQWRGSTPKGRQQPNKNESVKRRVRLGLARKFALCAAMLVAGTAIALGWNLYGIAKESLLVQEKEELAYRLEHSSLTANLARLRRDLRLLADSPSLRAFVDLSGSSDSENSLARFWAQQAAIAFRGMLSSNPDYLQIRFIGVDGRELVRVDRDGERIQRIEEAALQRKGDRPYFRDAIALPPGSIYISRIELNREHGAVVEPHQPVLRAATPIASESDRTDGILIINVDAEKWLDQLARSIASDRVVYVTNENSDYLLHPDAGRTFGFDLGRQIRLVDDMPDLAPIYASDGPSTLSIRTKDDAIYAVRVMLDAQQPDRYLVLVVMTPLKVALLGANRMRTWALFASAIMVLLGGLIAVFLAHLIAEPLEKLTLAVQRVTAGEKYDESILPVASGDEIGALAEAFRKMMRAVAEREASLRVLEKRTSAIIEAAGNAIITFDDKGHIERANQATQIMFGYNAEELASMRAGELIAPEERRRYESALGRLRPGGPLRRLGSGREVTALRQDGTTFPAHLVITDLSGPDRTTIIAVIADLTEMKKVEKLKDEFISTVSHELRTPLTSIKGSLSLLRSGVTGALPTKAQAMVNIACDNSERLVRLINDILDLEKIESGNMRFDFRPVNVAALLRQAKETCRPFADQCGVATELARAPTRLMVDADPDRLMQVLSNLISNAAKFSSPGATVTLAACRKGDMARICVIDRGKGIPAAFRDSVFAKFAQADSSDARAQPGTGLGLSISKQIVEAHGGRIGFETEEGVGTTFYFDLPVLPLSSAAQATRDGKAGPKALTGEAGTHVRAAPAGEGKPGNRGSASKGAER